MAIKPLADRVLIKATEANEEKRGSIIIPDTAKEKPMQGEVKEVGNGRQTEEGKIIPMTVKKGDGEELLIMRESDVLAIVE